MDDKIHLATLWQEVEQALEERLAEVKEEIKYYPPPIPACDVYFNSLLDERAKIPHALRHLNEQQQLSTNPLDLVQFVEGLSYLDKGVQESMMAMMHKTADFA